MIRIALNHKNERIIFVYRNLWFRGILCLMIKETIDSKDNIIFTLKAKEIIKDLSELEIRGKILEIIEDLGGRILHNEENNYPSDFGSQYIDII